jgi:3-hydroxyacyl-[acyl-carrier-protein] dehydratase
LLAGRSDIENYIPQRAPMIMIHDLMEASDVHAVSKLFIEANNIFVEGDYFTESGMIENIAQTAAAHAGYQYRQKGVPVPVGFIAAVKDLEILERPLLHSTIKTTVTVTNSVFDVTIIRGIIEQDGKIQCRCEMKIFTKST